MKHKQLLTALFISLSTLLATLSDAQADTVAPLDHSINTELNIAKGTASTVNIWTQESGGYDSTNSGRWGLNYWACTSSTSDENGKCPTGKGGYAAYLPVYLKFTEKRSGATQTLELQGTREAYWYNGNCAMYGDPKPMNQSAQNSCSGDSTDGVNLTLKIPAAELNKLPVGGIWTAQLKILLHNSSETEVYQWDSNITVNLTDNNNQQIYLPEFGEAAPRVDLNLRPLPGTKGNQTQMNGSATIDMCLYDGYGSNSTSFTLKFDDQQQGTTERNNGYFSIYSDHGDTNLDSGRIDYYVRMQAPDGKYVSVIRGDDLVISNIQTAHIRPVHLPGIPQAVLCVPAPLELSTKTMDINSKQAGNYTGHLIVNFTPQL
ncbi:CfaE/CblD family pilus tip adhesin [Rahnella aceris]|uniref:CfaE/CblD family pilus tip adhesin n=1 Tax=Rahnella sp. (strain Y9602) TaxID=2703885 RepID=UPI000EB38847|nr:CfaE/CblD family pilus tip adhesin [Rahnella aceris]MBU9866368.1 pilus assembly protein CblD [Rahnella aceris]RKT76230.1 CblD-like pilus biogenesis initiator [Rahnella aquatilis]